MKYKASQKIAIKLAASLFLGGTYNDLYDASSSVYQILEVDVHFQREYKKVPHEEAERMDEKIVKTLKKCVRVFYRKNPSLLYGRPSHLLYGRNEKANMRGRQPLFEDLDEMAEYSITSSWPVPMGYLLRFVYDFLSQQQGENDSIRWIKEQSSPEISKEKKVAYFLRENNLLLRGELPWWMFFKEHPEKSFYWKAWLEPKAIQVAEPETIDMLFFEPEVLPIKLPDPKVLDTLVPEPEPVEQILPKNS